MRQYETRETLLLLVFKAGTAFSRSSSSFLLKQVLLFFEAVAAFFWSRYCFSLKQQQLFSEAVAAWTLLTKQAQKQTLTPHRVISIFNQKFPMFPTFPTSFIFSWEIEETVRKLSFVSYFSYESFILWWEIGRNGEKDFPINLVLLC